MESNFFITEAAIQCPECGWTQECDLEARHSVSQTSEPYFINELNFDQKDAETEA